jgi:hypothetical protein
MFPEVLVLHLITSDRTARIASIYHNNAFDLPKSMEDIEDNARSVASELITCGTCRRRPKPGFLVNRRTCW